MSPRRKKIAFWFCLGIITLSVMRWPEAAVGAVGGGFMLLTHLLGF